MHKRKEIKAKVKEILSANITENVFGTRYLPISENDLPAVAVYCPDELAQIAKDGEHYQRNATVVIVCHVKGLDESEIADTGDDSVDTKLDDITSKIEALFLIQYSTLEQTVYSFELKSTKYQVSTEGDEIIGMAFMEWEAAYHDRIA